jgi:osmotically-inducible protein OsmY
VNPSVHAGRHEARAFVTDRNVRGGHFAVHGRMVGAADPHAWITMKTKLSLMTTEGVSTKDLNVDMVKGVVTLHGKVAIQAEKVKAHSRKRSRDVDYPFVFP